MEEARKQLPEELTVPQEVKDQLRERSLLPTMWYVGPLAVRGQAAITPPRRRVRRPPGPSAEIDN